MNKPTDVPQAEAQSRSIGDMMADAIERYMSEVQQLQYLHGKSGVSIAMGLEIAKSHLASALDDLLSKGGAHA